MGPRPLDEVGAARDDSPSVRRFNASHCTDSRSWVRTAASNAQLARFRRNGNRTPNLPAHLERRPTQPSSDEAFVELWVAMAAAAFVSTEDIGKVPLWSQLDANMSLRVGRRVV